MGMSALKCCNNSETHYGPEVNLENIPGVISANSEWESRDLSDISGMIQNLKGNTDKKSAENSLSYHKKSLLNITVGSNQSSDREDYLKKKLLMEIYQRAPLLVLEITNSDCIAKGTRFKINALGIEGSLRGDKDGFTYFGCKKKEEKIPGIANEIRKILNDFVLPGTDKDIKERLRGRHFYIEYCIRQDGYRIKDLGVGFGVFAKLNSEITLKDNQLFNIGIVFIMVNLSVDTTDKEDSMKVSTSTTKTRVEDLNILKMKMFGGPCCNESYNFEPSSQIITLGRGQNSKIHIDDTILSKIHCSVEYRQGIGWVLRDGQGKKNSTNGTWIYLAEDTEIYDGMTFKANQTIFQVFDVIREIVSGKKIRYKNKEYNLDLSYITRRLIAMSFPASGLELTYRNNIEDVATFIKDTHGRDFLIINLSGRKYDYSKFGNQVVEFNWEDHHSPDFITLFEGCKLIDSVLQASINNVVFVHCNAGKGRTGSLICCYLLYCGRMKTPEEAFLYYSLKRFNGKGGVTQPSQVRYVRYFYQILKGEKLYPTVKRIEMIKMFPPPSFGSSKGCRPLIELIDVAKQEMMYTNKSNYNDQAFIHESDPNPITIKIEQEMLCFGDLLVRILNNEKYKKNKNIARMGFNTSFIDKENKLRFEIKELDPDSIPRSSKYDKSFYIEIYFTNICKCENITSFKDKCEVCLKYLDGKLSKNWFQIDEIVKERVLEEILYKTKLFGDPDLDDIEEFLVGSTEKKEEKENIISDSGSDDEDSKIFDQNGGIGGLDKLSRQISLQEDNSGSPSKKCASEPFNFSK